MTLAAAGAEFLNATMKAAAGVSVKYLKKGSPDHMGEPLTAWTGTPGLDTATTRSGGTSAARLVTRERDYLIVLAELITLPSLGRVPVEGDRIIETVGGAEVVFEVCKRGTEPCWRYSDRERTRVRVHTKPSNPVV